jgi:hypothetical protein
MQGKASSSHSACFLLAGLTFDLEEDDNTFLRNLGELLSDYMASHTKG